MPTNKPTRKRPPKDNAPKPARRRYASTHGITRRGPRGGGLPVVEFSRPGPSEVKEPEAVDTPESDEVA